ncbi:MAG: tRNA (N(6)-L-threonylcarbamoyladenosine(37)-C(2))-methylthiotransferase MtaB [Patescibacteria group bacterium]
MLKVDFDANKSINLGPRFLIRTLGCKVNQYDSADLRRLLEQAGFMAVADRLDLVILNTCAVTLAAISKDKQALNKLKSDNKQAKLVVMGCWPKTYQPAIKADLVWGVGDLPKLVAQIKKIVKFSGFKYLESGLTVTDRSRYFLKVGDGCNQFCSYCVIPFARGRVKSRSEIELIQEARLAVKAGYREIVLSGIHLGLYGQDLRGHVNLVSLLKKLVKINGLGRLRLSSIEINEVDDQLIELIASNKKLCRHLHISLQAGSDKILKLMKRPYLVKDFRQRIEKIRQSMPDIALSTDIIVGFPGENEADFQMTYDFAKEMSFSKIHVFSFSAHPQTAAYKLSSRVSDGKIKERSQKLRALSDRLEKKYREAILRKYQGKSMAVIIDQKKRGKTEFHFDLDLRQDIGRPGEMLNVKV